MSGGYRVTSLQMAMSKPMRQKHRKHLKQLGYCSRHTAESVLSGPPPTAHLSHEYIIQYFDLEFLLSLWILL